MLLSAISSFFTYETFLLRRFLLGVAVNPYPVGLHVSAPSSLWPLFPLFPRYVRLVLLSGSLLGYMESTKNYIRS